MPFDAEGWLRENPPPGRNGQVPNRGNRGDSPANRPGDGSPPSTGPPAASGDARGATQGRGEGRGQGERRNRRQSREDRTWRVHRAKEFILGRLFRDSIQGKNGSDVLFDAVGALIEGFGLTRSETRWAVDVYNSVRCDPPWSDREIEHKIDDMEKRVGDKPRGRAFDDGPKKRANWRWKDYRPVKADRKVIEDAIVGFEKYKKFSDVLSNKEFLNEFAKLDSEDNEQALVIKAKLDECIRNWRLREFDSLIERTKGGILIPLDPPGAGDGGDGDDGDDREEDPDGNTPGTEDNPHRLARLYLGENHQSEDGLSLRFWREEFHRWDGASYQVFPPREIQGKVSESVSRDFQRIFEEDMAFPDPEGPPPRLLPVTTRLVGDILQALSGMTLLEESQYKKQPVWIEDRPESSAWPSEEMLPTQNEIIHLPSFADRVSPYSIPPTPNFFSPYSLNYRFAENASRPSRWIDFLEEIWQGDPESIECLQDWFGYLLVPDTSQHKILLLIGPPRSGKGTIARVLTHIVGYSNVCNPKLSSLSTHFGLASLLGKSVAIIADARISGRSDIALVVESMLNISGEDGQTIDRKYMSPVNTKLDTRFIIISNELPRLAESSGALVKRSIILNLTQDFYGKEDMSLTKKLCREASGILLWAIEGWKRLRDRGHFLQPKSSLPLVKEMEKLNSPIKQFVDDLCETGPKCQEKVSVLYGQWVEWCSRKGREHPGDEAKFGRDLRSILPEIKTKQHRERGTGWRARHFIGICFNPIYDPRKEETYKNCEEFGENEDDEANKEDLDVPY